MRRWLSRKPIIPETLPWRHWPEKRCNAVREKRLPFEGTRFEFYGRCELVRYHYGDHALQRGSDTPRWTTKWTDGGPMLSNLGVICSKPIDHESDDIILLKACLTKVIDLHPGGPLTRPEASGNSMYVHPVCYGDHVERQDYPCDVVRAAHGETLCEKSS